MSGIMVIDYNQINKLKITNEDLDEFKEFNKNTQLSFYFLFFKIFSNKYKKLKKQQIKCPYQDIEELYDFLFYYKHIIDTFHKQLKKTSKDNIKKIRGKIYDDPLTVFLICLRNYLEHNPFNSIKKKSDYTRKEEKIIFNVSDIYNSIKDKKYKETLKFLKNNEQKINIVPIIDECYNEILDYIMTIIYDYYDENIFCKMYNIYKSLENIELKLDEDNRSTYHLEISYALDMYKSIVINREFKSNRTSRIESNSFLLDVFLD